MLIVVRVWRSGGVGVGVGRMTGGMMTGGMMSGGMMSGGMTDEVIVIVTFIFINVIFLFKMASLLTPQQYACNYSKHSQQH